MKTWKSFSILLAFVSSLLVSGCSWFKKSQVYETPPEWASFFAPQEYATFLDLVRAYFQDLGLEVSIQDGALTIQDPQQEWQKNQMGLANLAQECHQFDQEKWRSIIKGHFDGIIASVKEEEDLKKIVMNFNEISSLLVVRLWPEEYFLSLSPEYYVYRKDMEGVISALVFDLPSQFRQVKPEEAAAWGKETGELFEIALQNIRQKSDPKVEIFELEKGIEVYILSDDTWLAPSHALLLGEHAECLGKEGALVAVPNRGGLLCYPINTLDAVLAARGLIPIIHGMFMDGPGSISPYLYWYHDNRFVNLPYQVNGKTIEFNPPQEFTDRISNLGE